MKLSLHNKVALVIGGVRGIGQAICFKLANAGAKVSIVDILDAELADTDQHQWRSGPGNPR